MVERVNVVALPNYLRVLNIPLPNTHKYKQTAFLQTLHSTHNSAGHFVDKYTLLLLVLHHYWFFT